MRRLVEWVTTVAMLCLAGNAGAQNESTMRQAGGIVSQPARDVGLARTTIPPVLEQAARSPYATEGTRNCSALALAVADLDEALGPDFGHSTTRRGSKAGSLAKQGGAAVVDSLIPFRGVVREVSGAAAAERRLAAAVNAGYARRGFLRGLSVARRCSPAL